MQATATHPAAQDADEALQRSVAAGRIEHYGDPRTPAREAQIVTLARAQSSRKCLSCGAEQSIDGMLPCGH